MDSQADHQISEEFAAALAWWRDAGVDCAFHDDPQTWVTPLAAEDRPRAQPQVDEPIRQTAVDDAKPILTDHLPQDFTGFAEWWLTSPDLDEGRVSGRIAPRGEMNPALMVVVPDPEPNDRHRLLSGPQGQLLDAILSAFGIRAEETYVASVLARHTPAADWAQISASGYGDVLRRHISLAAPRRLIVFGSNILPLIGHDLPQRSAVLQEFNHDGRSTPLLAGRSLSALIERPRWKVELWKAWLEWTKPPRESETTGIEPT